MQLNTISAINGPSLSCASATIVLYVSHGCRKRNRNEDGVHSTNDKGEDGPETTRAVRLIGAAAEQALNDPNAPKTTASFGPVDSGAVPNK